MTESGSAAGRGWHFRRMARVILAGVLVASTCAYLCAWIWPDDGGPRQGLGLALAYARFQLRTFWVHAGIAWLVIAVLALLVRSWRVAGAASIASIVALGPVATTWLQPSQSSPLIESTNREPGMLRVMTCNVLLINRDIDAIVAEIMRVGPDVVLFQEYTPTHSAGLRLLLASAYPHVIEASQRGSFGQAVYSKLEFVGSPELFPQFEFLEAHGLSPRFDGLIGSGDPQIRVVVRVPVGESPRGQEVVVQCVHLPTPVNLQYFNEQRWMSQWLASWVALERRPVVIAGDFNNTPHSVQARLLREAGASEAFAAVGRGLGGTWPKLGWRSLLPGVRLDQLWGKGLSPVWCEVGMPVGSDHRPAAAAWRVPQ